MGYEADKLGQARRSYGEVLRATEHQDDKIGRALGAIAFLVAAALVFVEPTVLSVTYAIDAREVPLPAMLLTGFLLTILGAALLYVLATSARLSLAAPRRAPDAANRRPRSYLFFLPIGQRSLADWRELWDVDDLPTSWVDSYIDETHNIAWRTTVKYERSTTAAALLSLSLLLLALFLVLSVHVLSRPVGGPLQLGGGARIAIAAILSGFGTLVVRQQFVEIRHEPTAAPVDAVALGLLCTTYLAAPAALVLRPPILLSVLALVASGLAAVHGIRILLEGRDLSVRVMRAAVSMLTIVGVLVVVAELELLQLVAAFLVAVSAVSLRLVRGFLAWINEVRHAWSSRRLRRSP